jgi:hypothetical protein
LRTARTLSESEFAELKKKARSSQELRKMIRTRSFEDPEVAAAKKPAGKRSRRAR